MNLKKICGVGQLIIGIGAIGISAYLFVTSNGKRNAEINSRIQKTEALIRYESCKKSAFLNLSKAVPAHDIALGKLNSTLKPIEHSINTIVALKEYVIMSKKPLYYLGNAFTGLQASIKDVQDSIMGIRHSMKILTKEDAELLKNIDANVASLQAEIHELNQLKEKHITSELLFFAVALLLGFGFIMNGTGDLAARNGPIPVMTAQHICSN